MKFNSRADWIVGKSTDENSVKLEANNTATILTGKHIYVGQTAGSDYNVLDIAGTLTTNAPQCSVRIHRNASPVPRSNLSASSVPSAPVRSEKWTSRATSSLSSPRDLAVDGPTPLTTRIKHSPSAQDALRSPHLMGRRKRDNSFETAKAIAGLILILALLLVGGDIRKLPAILSTLVIAFLGLCGLVVLGVIIAYIVRKCRPNPPLRFSEHPGAAIATSGLKPPDHDDPTSADIPQYFTQELIRSLEWRRFELLIEGLFRAEGLLAERIRAGADGGVDLVLRGTSDGPVKAIVQCKAWKTYTVGVKPVRELYGVMAAEGAPLGYFVCSGDYTSEAREWAKFKAMTLISGADLERRLNALPDETRQILLTEITMGDFQTPTCPSCEIKLVKRSSKHGEFWGCRSFPRCRVTIRS